MISMKTILLEGRYDSIVTGLSNRILKVFKDSYSSVTDSDGNFSGQKIYYKSKSDAPAINGNDFEYIWFEEIENETIPLEFYVELRIQWIDDLNIERYTVQEVNADALNEDNLTSYHAVTVADVTVTKTGSCSEFSQVVTLASTTNINVGDIITKVIEI
jgi:hypothetical protein